MLACGVDDHHSAKHVHTTIIVDEGIPLSQSLSVILPVCNAEATLASVVNQLLDVTSELTDALEVVIVDNGSWDNTIEVAMEVKREFPQVKVVRHTSNAIQDSAVRTGLAETSGEVVLIHNINAPFSAHAIRDLWMLRSEESMVFARLEPNSDGTESPVMHGRRALSGGTQMLRRDTMTHVSPSHIPTTGDPKSVPPAKMSSDSAANFRNPVTRTDEGSPAAPITSFHAHSSVEMQPDR